MNISKILFAKYYYNEVEYFLANIFLIVIYGILFE
jgi:hypothetical protein